MLDNSEGKELACPHCTALTKKHAIELMRIEDVSMESSLTTAIEHFRGHEDKRIRKLADKLDKSVELITEIVQNPDLIDEEDISMESNLTTCIDHFMGHEDDRISEAACKLNMAVNPITEVIRKYW